MELAADLTVDDTELRAFCRDHGIRNLRLFGSAARDELRDDSDIDLLLEFEYRAGPPVCSESPSSNSSSRSCSAERSTSEPSGI